MTHKIGITNPPDLAITTTIYLDAPFWDEHTDAKGATIIVYGLLRRVDGKYLLDLTVKEKYGKEFGGAIQTNGETKLGEPETIGCCGGITVFHTTLLTK